LLNHLGCFLAPRRIWLLAHVTHAIERELQNVKTLPEIQSGEVTKLEGLGLLRDMNRKGQVSRWQVTGDRRGKEDSSPLAPHRSTDRTIVFPWRSGELAVQCQGPFASLSATCQTPDFKGSKDSVSLQDPGTRTRGTHLGRVGSISSLGDLYLKGLATHKLHQIRRSFWGQSLDPWLQEKGSFYGKRLAHFSCEGVWLSIEQAKSKEVYHCVTSEV
jgi:hypothetical protein